METKYYFVVLLSSIYPFSVFCISDSSEEYREEEIYRPKYGLDIQWTNQGKVATTYKSLNEPAGHEDTFLCRAYHSKTWVPGKLIGKSCYITKNRVEHRFDEFQVPSIPDHKDARWVPLNENVERRHLPKNVIVGGNFWDTTAYICRGLFGGVLGSRVVIPGSYHPTEHICYLEHNGAQVAWKGDTEVLVLDEKVDAAVEPRNKTYSGKLNFL